MTAVPLLRYRRRVLLLSSRDKKGNIWTTGLRKAIETTSVESRREWMLKMMKDAGTINKNNRGFQLWQQHNNPIQLISNKIARQKLDYIHYNPVEAGFVTNPEDWLYSSAIDYYDGKGLLEIKVLDTLGL